MAKSTEKKSAAGGEPTSSPATSPSLEAPGHEGEMTDIGMAIEAEVADPSPPPALKPALVSMAVQPPRSDGKRRYRVWPHGDLHRNNVVYGAGAPIELTDSEAAALPCVTLCDD